MPVPNTMGDLSTTAGSNYPTGSEAIGNNLDNYLRAHASLIRQPFALAASSIASASSIDVAATIGESVEITGTATINGLGAGFTGCKRELRFSGSATLTHSASLQLPGAANVTAAAGDVFTFRCIASGVWVLVGGKTMPAGALPGHLPAWAAIDPVTKQDALGFAPVQQGTGVGQVSNTVKIGWDGSGKTKVTIDSADQGNIAMEGWSTSTFLALSGGTLSGNLNVTGAATAQGSLAIVQWQNRTGSEMWGWYATGGVSYLWNGAGNVAQVSTAGDAGFSGSIDDSLGNVRDIPQVVIPGNFDVAQVHRGRSLAKTGSTPYTGTIQPNSTIAIAVGTAVSFVNLGGTTGNLTIARGSGVAIYRNGVNADIVLAPGHSVTLLKVATDTWQA